MGLWTEDEENEKSFTLVPEGEYTCVLENCTVDTTKDPHMVKCVWKLTSSESTGQKMFQDFRFNDASKKYLMWQLGALGIGGVVRDAVNWDQGAIACAELLFKEVGKLHILGKISHREYNGKTYAGIIVDQIVDASVVNPGVKNHAPPVKMDNSDLPF